jgi:hypothetical protein
MSTRSKEQWPYVPVRSKRWSAVARWEDAAKAPRFNNAWTRWSWTALFFAVVAITLVSGIALAALHQDDSRRTDQRAASGETCSSCAVLDPHLQALLREHRRAVFGNY